MATPPTLIPGQAQEMQGPGAKAGNFDVSSPQLYKLHIRSAPMHRLLAQQALVTTGTILKGTPIVRMADGTWKQAIAPTNTPVLGWQARVSNTGASNDGYGGAAQPSYVSTYYPDTALSASLNYIANPNYEASTDQVSLFDTLGAPWTPAAGDKIAPGFGAGVAAPDGKWAKIAGGDTVSIQCGTILGVKPNIAIANNPANLTTVIVVLWKGVAA